MSTETNKAVARRFYDECSRGNLSILDELLDPDIVDHDALPGIPPGREGVKQFFAMLRSAFPDLRFEVSQLVAEGDLIVAHFTASGTHEGAFLSVPASGAQVSYAVFDVLRIANGRIVERWGMADRLSLLQQIGALPAPHKAPS